MNARTALLSYFMVQENLLFWRIPDLLFIVFKTSKSATSPIGATTIRAFRRKEGWQLFFEWLTGGIGISANESVDALAANAHHINGPTVSLRRYKKGRRFICDFYLKLHSDKEAADKWLPLAIPSRVAIEVASQKTASIKDMLSKGLDKSIVPPVNIVENGRIWRMCLWTA